MEKEKKYGLKVKDKNGKEIFLEDKVKFNEHSGIVAYNFKNCCFMVIWEDGDSRQMDEIFASQIEVFS